MYDFSGKIAVITGAAKGLGAAMAQRFLEDGAQGVAMLDLTQDALTATAARLDPTGTRTQTVICNVADYQSVEAALRKYTRGLDALIFLSIMPVSPGIASRPR